MLTQRVIAACLVLTKTAAQHIWLPGSAGA